MEGSMIDERARCIIQTYANVLRLQYQDEASAVGLESALPPHPDPADENPEFTKLLATICTRCKTTYLPDELHDCLPQTLEEEIPTFAQEVYLGDIAAAARAAMELAEDGYISDGDRRALRLLAHHATKDNPQATSVQPIPASVEEIPTAYVKEANHVREGIRRYGDAYGQVRERALVAYAESRSRLLTALEEKELTYVRLRNDLTSLVAAKEKEIAALQSASVLQKEAINALLEALRKPLMLSNGFRSQQDIYFDRLMQLANLANEHFPQSPTSGA